MSAREETEKEIGLAIRTVGEFAAASIRGELYHLDSNEQSARIRVALDALVGEAKREAIAAHDAEAVEGLWEYFLDDTGGWLARNRQSLDLLPCPDEATARAYANALNRADQRKEG